MRARSVCHGSTGALEPEVAREGGDHGQSAERRDGPHRAARLHLEFEPQVVQGVRDVVEAQRPARSLEPERGRLRVLEQRAPDDRRVAVGVRERRGRVGRTAQVVQHRHERALGHEHRRRVDDVLACGALVHRGIRGQFERGDERARRVADLARLRADRVHVEFARAGDDDRLGLGRRDDSRARLRAGERGLEVEHRRQPCVPRDLLGHAAAGEHAREDVRR